MNNQILQIGIRPVAFHHHIIGFILSSNGKAAVTHVLFKIGCGNAAHHSNNSILGETAKNHY